MFQQIIASDNWIVEGSPRKNLRESFDGMKKALFTERKSYGERCKIFTHAKDALEFLENNYG